MMSEHTESRATWMLLNAPRMCTLESATTSRVRVAFSIACFVLPPMPAMRPIARDKWSPFSGLTSVTSNVSGGERAEQASVGRGQRDRGLVLGRCLTYVEVVEAEQRH